jgi:hypothetical protein
MDLGKLKQVPVRMLDYAAICGTIEIQLICPVGMDLWHPNCIVSFGFCLRLFQIHWGSSYIASEIY